MICLRMILLGALLLTSFVASGQVSQHSLLHERIATNFSKATLLEVVSRLANEFDVPVGLERTINYQKQLAERMSLVDGQITWKESNIKH